METQSLSSSSATFTNSSFAQTSTFSLNQTSQSIVSDSQNETEEKSKDMKPSYKETETKYRVSIKLTNKSDLRTLLTDEK